MQERKRVVVARNTRHLVSNPVSSQTNRTPFLNSYGMSPSQINKVNKTVVLNKASRQVRPQKVVRPRKPGPDLLLGVPTVGTGNSAEYPTPEWFRNTRAVDVSVIVPLYKSQSVIQDLIRSWTLGGKLTWEIIFVDDSCPNDSKQAALTAWSYRKAELNQPVGKIIVNLENKGYGLACNTGAQWANGRILVFLNADTTVTPGWLEPMAELFQDNEVGLVGNLQLKEGGTWNGTIDGAGSEWSWKSECFEHIGRHIYQGKHLPKPMLPQDAPADLLQEAEREMVTGCCFAMPSELFHYLGGFNPNYRIGYWEDAELCMFVRELGYKVMFTPKSVIYHKLSHTHSGSHPFSTFNKQFFFNRWVHSGRIDPLVKDKREQPAVVKSILLRRSGAHGDVLVAAGVASALRKRHPEASILFLTDCPGVLKGHPFIDRVLSHEEVSDRLFQVFYDLDMCYEYRPKTNILAAYAESVGVNVDDCDVCIAPEPVAVPDNYIVVHAGHTLWSGRNWLTSNFVQLSSSLRERGHKVVCVGTTHDAALPCDLDLRGSTSIQQLAYVLQNARLFVGIDSMPMHVAQAVSTPGVVFFGSINPSYRIYRDNMTGVVADVPCLGCHHRKSAPSVVTNRCEAGQEVCITGVSVDLMLSKIEERL